MNLRRLILVALAAILLALLLVFWGGGRGTSPRANMASSQAEATRPNGGQDSAAEGLMGNIGPDLPLPSAAAPTNVGPALNPQFGFERVRLSEESPIDGGRRIKRVRLVETDFKYPLVRVEETLERDSVTGEERVLQRLAVVGDHIVVRLRPGTVVAALEEINRRHGGVVRRKLFGPDLYLVAFAKAAPDTVPSRAAVYSREPAVLYAEADPIGSLGDTTPNDARWANLWGMTMISAPKAWDLHRGTGQTVVGVVDSGVSPTQQDLAANMWSNPGETAGNGIDDDGNGFVDDVFGWDFYGDDNNPAPGISHGTHVAGTIAAVGNNATGVVGVIWSAKIMALKIAADSGTSVSVTAAIEALYYAAMMRERGINIRLTNHSWSGPGYTQALYDAIAANRAEGLLVICAAGNNGTNNDTSPYYPASYTLDNVIAVAASDTVNGRASFSNYGAVSVDLAAPGVSILSTIPGNTYSSMSGTSMATPHVVGAAALLWDFNPLLGYRDLRAALLGGVDTLAAWSGVVVTGGRLNVFKAMRLMKPGLSHTPLVNQLNDAPAYEVEAGITPGRMLATNSLYVAWNTTGATNAFSTLVFTPVTNDAYTAGIPAQSVGTVISYYLNAMTTNGVVVRDPTNAPARLHSFRVVEAVSLTVTGSPVRVGAVVPDYGAYVLASGITVNASASLVTPEEGGQRYACRGWTGTGSVAPTGAANSVSFLLGAPTTLDWQWVLQDRLTQQSSPAGIVNTSGWWDAGSTALTVTASESVLYGATNHHFVEWQLDGLRQPDATNPAVNPLVAVVMSAPRQALAVYLPATQDADGDGAADWWERFWFGTTNVQAGADADGDGASNGNEFHDQTDPLSAVDVPRPPGIAHAPLADPQTAPAPWTVSATITDNYVVASATLWWRRNTNAWTAATMTRAGDLYSAVIPAPGTNGDVFAYYLSAADNLGLSVTNSVSSFDVRYALAAWSPPAHTGVFLVAGTVTNRPVSLANGGNTSLVWSAGLGLHDRVESGTNGWVVSGTAGAWHIDTRRSASPTHAWYLGNASSGSYAASLQAQLTTPAFWVGRSPVLSFRHWIASERDNDLPGYAFDGGVVLISTNGGAFTAVEPAGGYPYRITYWQAPQFAQGTPCYAGTGGWQTATFDLAPYADREVRLRFEFRGDDNTQYEGWYVDDVAVSSTMDTNLWVYATPDSGAVAAAGAIDAAITFDGRRQATGDRRSWLLLANNSPQTPVISIPVSLSVRSPSRLRVDAAAQTSTNGEGRVTVATSLFDVDGEACRLELLYSQDGGAHWTNSWVASVAPAFGSSVVSNSLLPQVGGLATLNGAVAATNAIALTWDTTHAPAIGLATNVRVRARVWDGIFWSPSVTSAVFRVDNQPPSAISSLVVTSHVSGVWSTSRSIGGHWGASADGDGVGGIRYGLVLSVGPGSSGPFSLATAATQGAAAAGADGTNWWFGVVAMDAAGNRAPVIGAGPFRIDAVAPSAAGATVAVAHSPWGAYVVGNAVTSSWSGFSDAVSGVAGYYAGWADGGGTTNGMWTAGTSRVLAVSPGDMDRTNTVHVWARDAAGNIGASASRPILVLAGVGDFDGDGQLTVEEETAGTDANDAGRYFRFASVTNTALSNVWHVVLAWDSVTGRLYSVYRNDALTNGAGWLPAPSFTNVPGSGSRMSYTDSLDGVDHRFYKIGVRAP